MPQVQVDQDELNNLITGLQTVQGEASNAAQFVSQLESQLKEVQSAPVTPGLPTVDLSAAVATLGGVKTALGNIGAAAAVAPPATPETAPAPVQDFSEPAVLAAAAQTEGGQTADQSQAGASSPAVSAAGDASAPSAQVTGTSAGEPAPAVAAPAAAPAADPSAPAPASTDTTTNEPTPPPSGQ